MSELCQRKCCCERNQEIRNESLGEVILSQALSATLFTCILVFPFLCCCFDRPAFSYIIKRYTCDSMQIERSPRRQGSASFREFPSTVQMFAWVLALLAISEIQKTILDSLPDGSVMMVAFEASISHSGLFGRGKNNPSFCYTGCSDTWWTH